MDIANSYAVWKCLETHLVKFSRLCFNLNWNANNQFQWDKTEKGHFRKIFYKKFIIQFKKKKKSIFEVNILKFKHKKKNNHWLIILDFPFDYR